MIQAFNPANVWQQTRKTLENVRAVTHHVTDIEAFMKTADIRPVTTTVEVVRLFHPDLVVEMTATAQVPNDRFKPPARR